MLPRYVKNWLILGVIVECNLSGLQAMGAELADAMPVLGAAPAAAVALLIGCAGFALLSPQLALEAASGH